MDSRSSAESSQPAVNAEQLRHWVVQYRLAAVELVKQKRRELRALTDEQAFADTDMLLGMARGGWSAPWRERSSGLVEQQRIFQRLRRQLPQ